ncbi:MAG TPA: hypothetical protein VFQ82_10955 [Stellaceae bacterium]|jgi:hypothetical protein|nr:hypothetical protein [Stellaceae bacterium]
MPIELWIVAALAALGLTGVAALRLVRRRRAEPEDITRNIYTLW